MSIINGDGADNLLFGTTGDDSISGLAGNDLLEGNSGSDSLYGGNGNDELNGGPGTDWLDGGSGNDHLDGIPGAIDTLVGGAGDDVFLLDAGEPDLLVEDAGGGNDTVVFLGGMGNDDITPLPTGPFTYALSAEFENVLLHDDVPGAENVTVWLFSATGNNVANLISGNGAANTLSGLGGNDTLLGYGGNDTLDGGAGLDSFDGGAGNDAFVIERLLEQCNIRDSAGVDTLFSSVSYTGLQAGLDNLVLSGNAWIGVGNGAANVLSGTERANVLIGGAGNDTLIGSDGDDLMDGGVGADRFVFDTAPGAGNVDVIVDFSAAQGDRIVLDNDIYSALGAPGTLVAGAFNAGAGMSAAADADDRIVLDIVSGALYYDADGAGGAAAVQFAVIAVPAGVGAASLEVID